MSYSLQKYQSPIGLLYLVGDEHNLCGIIHEPMWPFFKERFASPETRETPVLKATKHQLGEYFAGRRQTFDLPLRLNGTPFQKKVWSALQQIPFGQTKSYKDQALAIKSPAAVRAVGRANGLNPISIVLPCHRVVGSNGALTGYAGGLAAKQFLLSLEAENMMTKAPASPHRVSEVV